MLWGHTAIFPEANGGGGFLGDLFKTPAKAIWDFEGIYAKSRHIPGVRFAGMIHPGIVATAPSQELLNEWNRREAELVNNAPDGKGKSMACLPHPKNSLLGLLEKNPSKAERVRKEAARTIPPREHGGNADIKNLHKGSKIWLPVYVPGANLSLGDIHFSEGDGEITLCGGIETAGIITLKTKVIKNGMDLYGLKRAPMFLPGPVEPRYSKYLTFEGLSVDEDGKQHFVDATLSFRQAILSAIDYLTKFGYTKEQVYLLIKNGMNLYGLKRAPMFLPGPVEPRYSKYLTFEGLSVDDHGKQHYIDATLSFRQAVLSAIDYLTKFGYTREQVYLFLSACPTESHIASIVDIPNACVTIGIPTEVFDFDILPKEGGPKVQVKGSIPPTVV